MYYPTASEGLTQSTAEGPTTESTGEGTTTESTGGEGVTTEQTVSPYPTDPESPSSSSSPALTRPSETPTNSRHSKSSTTYQAVVGIVVATVVLVVVAGATLIAVIVLVVRHRRQPQVDKSSTVEKGPTAPSSQITRVRSRNNYTSTPIYEEVSGTSEKYQSEEHDYDFINSVSIKPGDEPKNYEVPQSSPSKSNSSRNSSLYEVPGDVGRNTAAVDGRGPVQGTVSAVESGYDTPVHTQTNSQGVLQSGYDIPIDAQRLPNDRKENGYDTPIDAQALPTVRTEVGESVYATPANASYSQEESSAVYEDVGFGP